jgi:hypothetical protein
MPCWSQPMMFETPAAMMIFVQATPAAPVPLTTTFNSDICLPINFAALIKAASTTTAVPCWSS